MKRYDILPVQLEFHFEPTVESCPCCSPEGDSVRGSFRSMCGRHWREYEASFDSVSFEKDLEASLEKTEACYGGFRLPDGYFMD